MGSSVAISGGLGSYNGDITMFVCGMVVGAFVSTGDPIVEVLAFLLLMGPLPLQLPSPHKPATIMTPIRMIIKELNVTMNQFLRIHTIVTRTVEGAVVFCVSERMYSTLSCDGIELVDET